MKPLELNQTPPDTIHRECNADLYTTTPTGWTITGTCTWEGHTTPIMIGEPDQHPHRIQWEWECPSCAAVHYEEPCHPNRNP